MNSPACTCNFFYESYLAHDRFEERSRTNRRIARIRSNRKRAGNQSWLLERFFGYPVAKQTIEARAFALPSWIPARLRSNPASNQTRAGSRVVFVERVTEFIETSVLYPTPTQRTDTRRPNQLAFHDGLLVGSASPFQTIKKPVNQ